MSSGSSRRENSEFNSIDDNGVIKCISFTSAIERQYFYKSGNALLLRGNCNNITGFCSKPFSSGIWIFEGFFANSIKNLCLLFFFFF